MNIYKKIGLIFLFSVLLINLIMSLQNMNFNITGILIVFFIPGVGLIIYGNMKEDSMINQLNKS